MKIFIIQLPQARGSLLTRLFEATGKAAVAGGHLNFRGIEHLAPENKFDDFAEDKAVVFRDAYYVSADWKVSVGWWSELLRRNPGSHLIFLSRSTDEIELSVVGRKDKWIPSYARCMGCLVRKVKEVEKHMRSFADMNPKSVTFFDSAGFGNYKDTFKLLLRTGITLKKDLWEKEMKTFTNSGLIRPKSLSKEITSPMFVLPEPTGPFLENVEVHTLRYGEPNWLPVMVPTQETWCQRHGYSLKVWDDGGLETPKFRIVEMLRDFLNGSKEWFLFLDADVFVHPSAPKLPLLHSGLNVVIDKIGKWSRDFPKWAENHFGQDSYDKWKYFNSGVWSIDRRSAKILIQEMTGVFHRGGEWSGQLPSDYNRSFMAGCQEQHQFNFWAFTASRKGLSVHYIGSEWNVMDRSVDLPGWFHHPAGRSGAKLEKIDHSRSLRLLPQKPEIIADVFPDPLFDRAVVWPWKSNAAKWEELKFSMRSVLENFLDKECPLVILGDKRPGWLVDHPRVRFLEADSYQKALSLGTTCADKVLWMNDDICLLKPCGWEEFETWHSFGNYRDGQENEWLNDRNIWRSGTARALIDLSHRRRGRINFSTHTPYVYERGKVLEIFRIYGIWRKMVLELVYGNHFKVPHEKKKDFKTSDPDSNGVVLNYTDRFITMNFKKSMARRFPVPASWEKKIVKDTRHSYPMHIDEPHREIIADLLKEFKPEVITEIGCFKGFSTTVFLDPVREGAFLNLIEPNPQPELLKLVGNSGLKDRIVLHSKSSWDTDIEVSDFIFIDGDHGYKAYADTLWALSLNPKVIVMHDSRSFSLGMGQCHGSEKASKFLSKLPGRTFLEDKEPREGFFTERGLSWSIRNDP